MHLVYDTLPIVVGCILIIFRRRFARYAIGFQNEMWGLHFGEDMVRIGGWIVSVVGLGIIWTGIQALLNGAKTNTPGGVQHQPSLFNGGIIIIAIGVILMLLDKALARYSSKFLAKVARIEVSKADAKRLGHYSLFMGITAVALGILMLIEATRI